MNSDIELRRKMQEHISRIKSGEDIFNLFKFLNYPDNIILDISSKRKKETFDFKKEDDVRIKEIYSILSFDEKLPVFLLETTTLTSSFIRSVTTTFDRQYLHFLLIFSVNYSEIVFVFPNREKIEMGKHKLKLTKLILNKEEIHYTDIQTLSNILYKGESNWRDIWRKWRKAFSVERVTEEFFEDYKNIFFTLRKELDEQKIPRKEAHEFTLQFLNRIMFIYFISKKKWLGNIKFMEWLWTSYKVSEKYGSDKFYENWLKQIFFKAFNNRSNEISELPEEVQNVLYNAPYLNGGLFTQNDLDELKIKITDKMFQKIFNFFEKYNFTIKEDMPLEQEVAVDPQMIGYVYESLANVADEIYDRNDLGIFYTPRVEVNFMCRRSLVQYLINHLANVPKDKIYHLVFDLPEESEEIEKWFDDEGLWDTLKETLDNLSVVDPACGSGAFLVGMLNVLYALYKTIYRHIKGDYADISLKENIIGRSLYGVDVMPWAVHAAELRLWLQLIVETAFKKEELKKRPLLPNLNLNLRVGDSLVQEIGGINLHLRTANISDRLKKKLYALKGEKEKYFRNWPARFSKREEFLEEEVRIFEEIIDDRILYLKNKVKSLLERIDKLKKTRQVDLFGKVPESEQKKLIDEKKGTEKLTEKITGEIKNLENIRELLKDPEKKPFVWDIDFAEIFGEKNGFDIVIGNPPYVRQEKISPPNRTKAEVTLEDRREYKNKLIKSVKTQFPAVEKIGGKSDYYLYFYFHGLSLLNEKGTFCFITSNSWLDVGYGRDLQEFLLKYVPIIAIYDNPKRSFEHAAINTIIAVFGAPKFNEEKIGGLRIVEKNDQSMLDHTSKFVMFKKPFEEVLSARNLIEIDNIKVEARGESITELVKNIVRTNNYRVFPILQEDLLEEGWGYPENYDKNNSRFKSGSYAGNKWGGKYLRAPDIFYTILGKGRGKLVKLGKIAKVSRGFTTGTNDFFFVKDVTEKIKKEKYFYWDKILNKREMKTIDEVKEKGLRIITPSKFKSNSKNALYFLIEEKFLKPGFQNTSDSESIFIENEKLSLRLLFVLNNIEKREFVYDYVKWGEKEGFNKIKTCKARKSWYQLGHKSPSKVGFNYNIGEVGYFYWSKSPLYFSDNFQMVYSEETIGFLGTSSLNWLMQNIYGRISFGGGKMKLQTYELKQVLFPDPDKFSTDDLYKINELGGKLTQRTSNFSIFEELGINPSKSIREQEPKPLPDRTELDRIIFDELGLTEEERKEVYWSVCELVKQRLEKARSLKKR